MQYRIVVSNFRHENLLQFSQKIGTLLFCWLLVLTMLFKLFLVKQKAIRTTETNYLKNPRFQGFYELQFNFCFCRLFKFVYTLLQKVKQNHWIDISNELNMLIILFTFLIDKLSMPFFIMFVRSCNTTQLIWLVIYGKYSLICINYNV